MQSDDDARRVLDRVAVVRHQCDLDLLLFFIQHPNTLLTSEQLAAFVGYELTRISASLDTLIGAELLRRSQSSTHAARLYEFIPEASGDWLPSLRRLGSTREGRLALKAALQPERGNDTKGGSTDSTVPSTSARISRIDERRNGEKRHA